MTTTVKVSARAWGATVTISSEGSSADVIELGANEDRTFHIEPGQSLTVDHGKEPATLNGEDDQVKAEVKPAPRGKPITEPTIGA